MARKKPKKKRTKTNNTIKASKKRKSFQRWDEHLVAAVLVVAGIAILIILAGVISSTGQATFSGLPDSNGVVNMLNQNTQVIEGNGRMKCTFACGKVEKQAVASYIDNSPTGNDEIVQGGYVCNCIGNN